MIALTDSGNRARFYAHKYSNSISTFDTFNIIWCTSWYGWKALSPSFPKLFQIENQLNIKKVMSKNIMSPYSVCWVSFDTFDIHFITALTVYVELLLTPSTYIAFDQVFIVQYSISHFRHLQHQSWNVSFIVDSNSKYSNYMKFQLKALNCNKVWTFWITTTLN